MFVFEKNALSNDFSNDINGDGCHLGMASTGIASDSRCVMVIRLWGLEVGKLVTLVGIRIVFGSCLQ